MAASSIVFPTAGSSGFEMSMMGSWIGEVVGPAIVAVDL